MKTLMTVRYARWACYIAGPAAFLGFWQLSVDTGFLNPFFFPTPLQLIRHSSLMFDSDGIGADLLVTCRRLVAIGAVSLALGLPLGYLLSRIRLADALLEDTIAFIYAVPSVILFPLITFIFGRNDTAVVMSASITPVIVMTLATKSSLQHVSPTYIEAGTNFGARGPRLVRLVVFPAILPNLTSNLRVALSLGLIGLTAIEMVGASNGLGAFMWNNWALMRVNEMYLALVAIAAIGVFIAVGLDWLFRRTMPWSTEVA